MQPHDTSDQIRLRCDYQDYLRERFSTGILSIRPMTQFRRQM